MMKNKFRYIVLLFAIVGLQSCYVITKKYERTEMYKVDKYRIEKENSDTTSVATISWREFFNDELLKGYIEEALEQNLDLLQAVERVNMAESMLKKARMSLLPTLNAQGSYAHNEVSVETFSTKTLPKNTHFDDIKAVGMFSWELDIWGKISAQKRATIATYLQSQSAMQMAQSQLVVGISNSYYTLLSLDAKKVALERNIENRKEGLETIKALKESGAATEVAVKQNEALLYTAQAMLVDVEVAVKQTENALSVMLGRVPQSIERGHLEEQKLPSVLATGVPAQLLDNRPDVLMAEYNFVNAFEMTNVARASFLPNVSINAVGGYNADTFENLFDARAMFSNLLGNLTLPIFNQRALRTQKEVRMSEQEIAFLNYKNTVLNAYREVSNAVYSLDASTKKLEIIELQTNALDKAVVDSEELQKHGYANYLEVLQAKSSALNSQMALVDAQLKNLLSSTDLYRALGGGWK